MIAKLKLKPKHVLLEMPAETEQEVVQMNNGLYLKKLGDAKYAPTHGVVITTTADSILVGDTVFFGNHVWAAAKRTAFGDPESKGVPLPSAYFALIEDGRYYLIIPENRLYFIKRGEDIIVLNNHVIAEPIKKQQEIRSGLLIVDLKEEDYVEDTYRVFLAPKDSGLECGDVVTTLRHCDIEVENRLQNPVLPDKFFLIEADNIVAKTI